MLHHALFNAEEASGMASCMPFCVQNQMMRKSPGANVAVAETFTNDTSNSASRKIKP
jgi:hypothetical protein